VQPGRQGCAHARKRAGARPSVHALTPLDRETEAAHGSKAPWPK
jgi:hypothetical protein